MSISGLRPRPPVLVYHGVISRPPRRLARRGLLVNPAEFRWQMDNLARRGFQTLTLDEYAAGLEGARLPRRSVLLTFDDAYAHLDATVTPILEEQGFTAVLFPSWESLGRRSEELGGPAAFRELSVASPGQLAAMAAGPWEVGSHALRHIDLRSLEPEQLVSDLFRARQLLSDLMARPVLDLAYPYGHQDASVRRAARLAGYRMAFTVKHGRPGDRFRLPRQQVNGEDPRFLFRLASGPLSHPWLRLAGNLAPDGLKGSIRSGRGRLVARFPNARA